MIRRSFRVAAVLVLTAAKGLAQSGVPVLRDFEDLPVGTVVFNQYDGVTFVGGDQSPFFNRPMITAPSTGTVSPVRVVSKSPTCDEFSCSNLQRLQFDIDQYRVSLTTGLADALMPPLSGYAPRLQAFSSAGVLVVEKIGPCLGSGPTPIMTPLAIDDSFGRISYVDLTIVACGGGQVSVVRGGTLAIDNLLYDRPLHPPPRESAPPVITITTPTNGATVFGATPGSVSLGIKSTVSETAVYTMRAQLNGAPPFPVYFYRQDATTFFANFDVFSANGLVPGNNTLTVTASDFDRPQNTGSTTINFNFQVLPIPPAPDIWPTAYEVTQTIDHGPRPLASNDYNDSNLNYRVFVGGTPPLVRGKDTLVRVYAALSGDFPTARNVPAVMSVYRESCTPTCYIASGIPPLAAKAPFTPDVPNTKGILVPHFPPPGTDLIYGVNDLNSSWSFVVPASWTTDDLIIYVDINDGAYSGFTPQPDVAECTTPVAATCRFNNELEMHLHFEAGPGDLLVNPVYVHFQGTYNGKPYNDVVPTAAQVITVFSVLNELYPEHVRQGERRDLTVAPGISADDLLNKIGDYDSDNDREIFMGMVPLDTNVAAHLYNGKDIVGLSLVGGRGTWANVAKPRAVAHELAHSIGFDHWGCEDGSTADECGVFPIAHGGTGVIGTDIANWKVILPGNPASGQAHTHDFEIPTPYDDSWVSWYTYDILFHHNGLGSYDTDDPPALLIRGSIDPTGVATLKPAYVISVNHPIAETFPEDDTKGLHNIVGYDAVGNPLLVHDFEPFKVSVHDETYGKVLDIHEAIPIVPNVERLAVFKGTQLLGELVNRFPGATPSVSITMPTGGSVWPVGVPQTVRWIASSPSGLPLVAQVQYSRDGGTTRITLARDITGSELVVDPDEVAGTSQAVIYVGVSDGMNVATATAGPFTVASKPPTVTILTPRPFAQVVAPLPLDLEGAAFDRQEALSDEAFQWSSDRDGPLGTGREVTVANLTVGLHTIILTVLDSQGLTGEDSVRLQVLPSTTEDFGVIPADEDALKCENRVANRVAKFSKAIVKCHTKNVTRAFKEPSFEEETCEAEARTKFDAANEHLKRCPQCLLDNGRAVGDQIEAFRDRINGSIYCTSGTALDPDDGGVVPTDPQAQRCGNKIAKSAAKLAKAVVQCHIKGMRAVFAGQGFADDPCEAAARAKYDGGSGSLGVCPPCVMMNMANIADETEQFLDALNGGLYCAGTVPLE